MCDVHMQKRVQEVLSMMCPVYFYTHDHVPHVQLFWSKILYIWMQSNKYTNIFGNYVSGVNEITIINYFYTIYYNGNKDFVKKTLYSQIL